MEQINYDPDNYNKDWFEGLTRFDEHNETAFYAVLSLLGKPDRLLDLGCGTGHIVRKSILMGIYGLGVELPTYADWRKHDMNVILHDLRYPLRLMFDYDMVLSWEVAEHIPAEYADTYCDNLAKYADKWLVLTAAHENQGGNWHVNEQPQSYWIEKIETRGLKYRPEESERLKILWTYTTGPMHWLPENVMVFKREE